MALAVSWIVYVFITLSISVILSGRLVGYRPSRFLKDTLPYLFASFVAVGIACVATLYISQPLPCIAVNILVAGVLYLAICKGLKLEMLKEIEHWFAVFRRKR
jgi:hypothetical protein